MPLNVKIGKFGGGKIRAVVFIKNKKAAAFKTHQGGAFSWQNAISATKELLLELRFPTLTDVLTEPGSPML